MNIPFDILEKWTEILGQTKAAHFKLHTTGITISGTRIPKSSPIVPKQDYVKTKIVKIATIDINSPYIGYFSQSENKGGAPFVKIGDPINEGTIIAVVRSLGIIHHIKSTCTGTVSALLVEDGQAIQWGQPIARIEPQI